MGVSEGTQRAALGLWKGGGRSEAWASRAARANRETLSVWETLAVRAPNGPRAAGLVRAARAVRAAGGALAAAAVLAAGAVLASGWRLGASAMGHAGDAHPGMDVAGGAALGGLSGIDWQLYGTLFLNGLSEASHMFLVAVGLSLIFGVMRVLNLAHGALHILTVYVATTLIAWWSNWWLALLVAPLVVAALGAVVEVGLLRPMYGRPATYVLILTFGLVLILHDVLKIGWGVDYKILPEPPALQGVVEIFGIVYPVMYLFGIGVAAALGLLLWLFLTRTRPGRIIRACAEDREMAGSLGINVPLVYTAVFAAGVFLTGLGGVLMGTIMATSAPEAFDTMLYAFAVVVIGGLGSLGGAALGSFLVGQLNAFGLLLMPEWSMAFMFLAMALVLVLRPRGLMGKGGS